MLAGAMFKLEIPDFQTLRAVIVGNDLDFPVKQVTLWCRVSPSAIGRLIVGSGKSGIEQWDRLFSFSVKKIDNHCQIGRITWPDHLPYFIQDLSQIGELVGNEGGINQIGDLLHKRISGFKNFRVQDNLSKFGCLSSS